MDNVVDPLKTIHPPDQLLYQIWFCRSSPETFSGFHWIFNFGFGWNMA